MKPSTAQVLSIHQRPNLRLQGHDVEVVAHAVHAAVLLLVPWIAMVLCGHGAKRKGFALEDLLELWWIYVAFRGTMMILPMVFRDLKTAEIESCNMLLKGGKHFTFGSIWKFEPDFEALDKEFDLSKWHGLVSNVFNHE